MFPLETCSHLSHCHRHHQHRHRHNQLYQLYQLLIINHHWWRSRRCCFPPPSTLYKTRAGQSSLEAFGEGRAGDGYHYDGHDGHDQHDYDAISKSVGQPSQFNGDLFVLVQFYMLHGV